MASREASLQNLSPPCSRPVTTDRQGLHFPPRSEKKACQGRPLWALNSSRIYPGWSRPDGSTTNLGEIPLDTNGEGKLNASTKSQTFALVVTAEPYFAVALPSEIVVLVNDATKNTKGKLYLRIATSS